MLYTTCNYTDHNFLTITQAPACVERRVIPEEFTATSFCSRASSSLHQDKLFISKPSISQSGLHTLLTYFLTPVFQFFSSKSNSRYCSPLLYETCRDSPSMGQIYSSSDLLLYSETSDNGLSKQRAAVCTASMARISL